jgi:hypothetical protein
LVVNRRDASGADSGEELTVWSYELVRQIPLHYDEGVTLKGIDLYRYSPHTTHKHTRHTHAALALTAHAHASPRYHVSRRFFLPQAKYYQTITGFANMTHVYNVRSDINFFK